MFVKSDVYVGNEVVCTVHCVCKTIGITCHFSNFTAPALKKKDLILFLIIKFLNIYKEKRNQEKNKKAIPPRTLKS